MCGILCVELTVYQSSSHSVLAPSILGTTTAEELEMTASPPRTSNDTPDVPGERYHTPEVYESGQSTCPYRLERKLCRVVSPQRIMSRPRPASRRCDMEPWHESLLGDEPVNELNTNTSHVPGHDPRLLLAVDKLLLEFLRPAGNPSIPPASV